MELKLVMTEDFEQQLSKMLSNMLAETINETKLRQINAPDYMTVNQVKEYLQISYPTLRKLELEYGLKSVTLLETKKLFIKSTVDAFMQSFEQ